MPIRYVITDVYEDHALISIVCTVVTYLTSWNHKVHSKANTEAELSGQLILV